MARQTEKEGLESGIGREKLFAMNFTTIPLKSRKAEDLFGTVKSCFDETEEPFLRSHSEENVFTVQKNVQLYVPIARFFTSSILP